MIKTLKLLAFRNIQNMTLGFGDGVNIILAPNASGKTNILESVFMLATGKSFKAKVEEEVINYDADISRITGLADETKLEIVLTRGFINIGKNIPEKVSRKKLTLNGIPKRLIDFAGNLKVVLFAPQDMDLVTESPSLRRKFLDTVLSQTDREYRRAILSYDKGLRQRNRLLFRIREEGVSRSHLLFWNQLLIKNGDYISRKREEFIDFVNSVNDVEDIDYSIIHDRSAISEGRLDQYKNEEIAAATTLVGPHRDDFVFKMDGRELGSYGSRGQQRMAVLWLKIAELSYIKKTTESDTVLLLDDIFSELDHMHRKIVMDVVGKQQTIITSSEEHFLEDFKNDSIKVIDICQ